MPCGGIEPIKRAESDPPALTIKDELHCTEGGCWICGRGGAYHFMHEWDTWIHARCAIQYLNGGLNPRSIPSPNPENGTEIHPLDEEAQIIIEHGHAVILDFSLEETT